MNSFILSRSKYQIFLLNKIYILNQNEFIYKIEYKNNKNFFKSKI